MKWLLAGLALTFVPVWRDDMNPDHGLCLWEYINMAAVEREHIPVETAIENYRRNKL